MQKTSFFKFDIILLAAALSLIVIGIFFIFSSGVTSTGEIKSQEYLKQILWAVLGILLMVLLIFYNYSQLKPLAITIYILAVVSLIFTFFFGKLVNGARSWIYLGFLGFQPSEFTKLAAILMLGYYLEQTGNKIQNLSQFLIGMGIVLLPMSFILIQPDMGTALVFIPIFLTMSFAAGAKIRHIAFLLLIGVLTIIFLIVPEYEKMLSGGKFPVLNFLRNETFIIIVSLALAGVAGLSTWGYLSLKRKFFYWILYSEVILFISLLLSWVASFKLQGYQLQRLITFLNPYYDSKGTGWNIIQSVTAVGSGGLFGKGFLQGTQSHYQFLPQQSTDFIFSILSEEWGFIGGVAVLLLFLVILSRGIKIISSTKDRFAVYIGAGILGMIYFHIIINIGMTIGIMPITGIPLLFLSYGGSSLWTALMGIGIMLSISFKNKKY